MENDSEAPAATDTGRLDVVIVESTGDGDRLKSESVLAPLLVIVNVCVADSPTR
jgi:hypothetical protein